MSAVTLNHIRKEFDGVTVLNDFNDRFEDGEFITLLGPSGCGKTTMLRIIAGFEKPSQGEVWIGQKQMTGDKIFVPPEKRGIGMVFQNYAVWPHMSIADNVAYPLKIQKLSRQEISRRVDQALKIVHLSQYAERFPNQLSGGQQQRVALARALVSAPGLLLLDEPLSNLDAKLRESMRFEIKEIQQELGLTVVYVTHDQNEAMAMSDRIFVINHGIVQQCGRPEEIYRHPCNQFVADFLGKVDFFKGTANAGIVRLRDIACKPVPCPETCQGRVDVAIRPENLYISPDGPIEGTLERIYYLGDTADCRIRSGEKTIRMILNGHYYSQLTLHQEIHLAIRDMTIFPDDGTLEEMLKIQT